MFFHTYIHTYTLTCILSYICTCTCAGTGTDTRSPTRTHTHTHMHIHIRNMYIPVCVYIPAYTHLDAKTNAGCASRQNQKHTGVLQQGQGQGCPLLAGTGPGPDHQCHAVRCVQHSKAQPSVRNFGIQG